MRKGMPVVAIVAAALLWGGGGQAFAPERAEAAAQACQRQSSSVYVELSVSRYPETTDHWKDAVAAGHPALLHVDRENAELHRDQSLANWPPRTGYDRDEYPPAMSRQGGYGASVRYIDPSDNRGAGSVMGNALEDYCEDQPFRIRYIP